MSASPSYGRPSGRALLIALSVLVATFLVPAVADRYQLYIVQLIAFQVIVTVGLSLLMGHTGQGSVAHPAFAAIGAYLSTILMVRFGAPFLVAAPVSALIAGVVGWLLGFPALRLSGHYLLLVTLGFLQIVQVILVTWVPVTGGPAGMKAATPVIFGARFGTPAMLYWLIIPTMLAMVVIAFNIVNSRIGRAFTAIRDSAVAAAAVGIDVARYKTMAFGVSAFYAGLAGTLYAPLIGFLDPLEFWLWSALAQITFLVVGGMYSLWGAILGAVLLTALPEALRAAQEFRELGFGLLLLLFLLFAPTGIVGRLSDLLRKRRQARADAAKAGQA
jgi:ABC-type branched-subunit amino acid transport system permease subunit